MLQQAKNTNPNINYINCKKVINIPAIVIIPEISQLKNLNSSEEKMLALISQLDNERGCDAKNPYFMEVLGLCKKQIQNIIAKLEKFGYIKRTIFNYFGRKITSIFSVYYKNKKFKKADKSITPPYASNCTNKEELNNSLSTKGQKLTKKERVMEYLDQNLTKEEQIEYFEWVSKKKDCNSITVESMFNHKGWMKWFKVELRIKTKGQAIGQQLNNIYKNFGSGNKNKGISGIGRVSNYQPSMRELEDRKNAILNGFSVV